MPVEALPDVAPPVENPPAAVQESAFVELHESVEDCPLSIVLGFAESDAVGAHACVLQLWLEEPLQVAPSFSGAGLVQLLVWVPPPQLTEQLDQSDHPPSTGAGAGEPVPGSQPQRTSAGQ